MIKQVIVMRKDLKCRRGKEIAQGAHASMMFLTTEIRKSLAGEYEHYMAAELPPFTPEQIEWIEGSFTKICVGVNSEEELDAIYATAQAAGLTVHMVVDKGLTEFHNVPTKTCLAIGPAANEEIDKITGHLRLL